MTRTLAAVLLAGGLAATALTAVPAQAAPWCGTLVGVNCWNGSHYCRIWVAPTRTCTHTA